MVLAFAEHARDRLALLGNTQPFVGAQRLDVDLTRHSAKLSARPGICETLLAAPGLAPLGAEPDRFGERPPLFGIIRSDHRIVGGKAPLLTVLILRPIIVRHQMPLG